MKHKPPDVRELLECILQNTIQILACCGTGRRKHVTFKFAFGLPTTKEKPRMPAETTITNEQKIPVTITPLSEAGKPAKIDGALAWSVISGSATVVDVSADGLTATLVSGDDPGDTDVLVKGDADLGAGVVEVSDTIRLHVQGAQAKSLGISFGAPEAKV